MLSLIITIIVLVILAGVAINTLYGENGIITTAQDVAILSNIKTLEEGIDLYKVNSNLEGKVEEDSYPIAKNEDGSRITLNQMKSQSELAKLPDEVKYTLLNLTSEKGTTNIPSLDQIDYNKFYKLDYTKLSISQEEAENLVIYIDGDDYKVINLPGVKYKKNNVYVIIPLNNEAEPEYITVANNTYKLYGNGTLKVLGEKTTNSGYTSSEVNAINNSWDEFDLKAINERFDNRMNLPDTLTSDWYASHVYFSTGTAYVIDDNSDLWAWGANDYNKLGLGHSFLVVGPTKILEGRCEGEDNVKASKVWAGATNTFVVDTHNTLWACGTNRYGTLGQGNFDNYSKWVKIDYINGEEIKEIQSRNDFQSPAAIIILKDGSVYGAGCSLGELNKIGNINRYEKIEAYYKAKSIYLGRNYIFFIKNDGNLYGCGWLKMFGTNENIKAENALMIEKNVKQVIADSVYVLYLTEENQLYYRIYNNTKKIENIEINSEIKLTDKFSFIMDNNFYLISYTQGIATKSRENASPYFNNYGVDSFLQTRAMNIYITKERKIYVQGNPNITKIEEKSNYDLRKVFENTLFVQGKEDNINIVDRNGKVYEGINSEANQQIKNAKKIIASNSSKYVIRNDGTLFAKGTDLTGMWGELIRKDNYIEITKDGINNFANVKDIYTSSMGKSAILLTTDNKIYWSGSDAYIILPNIKGDNPVSGNGNITNYPKEVESVVLEKIRGKIKDIEYSYINAGGINGKNTLMLTEDGKLYTMSTDKNMSGNNTIVSNLNGDFTELTIKEGTTVKQILTEDGLSLALLSTGEVYGWGYNTYGILGSSYEVGGIYPTPVKLEGLPANIRYMSLGNGFAIFASKSGEVYGIGKNDYGQLGTGDSIGRTEFVRCTKLEE